MAFMRDGRNSNAAMAAHDGTGNRPSFWSNIFGARGAEDDTVDLPSLREVIGVKFSREVDRRKALYDDIGRFLFSHDLDLTPLNFGLAHDYLTGNDHALEKAIGAILREKGQLTNGSAEALIAERNAESITPEALGAVLDKVESNLGQITALVEGSRASARSYGAALQEQVRDLADIDNEPVFAKLVALTRSMVEKTREVETRMRESQKNTRLLQKNLESARKAAEQDHLTGLPNRRAFEATLKELAQEARDAGEPLALAFCDIDHFKMINDTHGHETGDRVLKFVGALLNEVSNDHCHVARHGGEEFVMLFRGRTAAEACVIVDTAREDLSTRNLVNRANGQRMERITFSAGVADVCAYADGRAALKAADAALYRAKESGRNRVYLAADVA